MNLIVYISLFLRNPEHFYTHFLQIVFFFHSAFKYSENQIET